MSGRQPERQQEEGGRRIVKIGRRRAVSRPAAPVDPVIDPTLDGLGAPDVADAPDSPASREAERDAWLRAQRPPHW